MAYEMKSITAKEALERMMAGEVVSAAIIKPMTSSHFPKLLEFKIVDDAVYIADDSKYPLEHWEQYHCAVNTFLKFDFFIPEVKEVARYVGPRSETVISEDSDGMISVETMTSPDTRMSK